MVDLTIAPHPGQSLPKDTYVALRVGDVQKLGRISSERRYNFPDTAIGDHRFGKVEILRKVSGFTVGINPDKDGLQDFDVPLHPQNVKFSVSCKPSPNPPTKEKKPPKEDRPRVKKAKAYLDKYNLELMLKDAMQEVIRAMPEDPLAFIAKHLLERRSMVTEGDPSKAPREPLPDDPEELRQKANGILMESADDGSLESATAGADNDETRLQVQRGLLESSESGKLDQVIMTDLAGQPDSETEQLRNQARQTLMQATQTGRLNEALENVKSGGAAPGAAPVDNEIENLRAQARATLMNGSAEGRLDAAVEQAREASKRASVVSTSGNDEVEALRAQAKQTLLDATKTGNLDAALASVKKSGDEQAEASESVKASKEDAETEELRAQAKATLLDATSSGKLNEALQSVKGVQDEEKTSGGAEVEDEAKQTLPKTTESGELNDALETVKGTEGADDDEELLRQETREVILKASKDGTLDDAMQKDGDLESVRQRAAASIAEAEASGQLDESLAAVRGPASPAAGDAAAAGAEGDAPAGDAAAAEGAAAEGGAPAAGGDAPAGEQGAEGASPAAASAAAGGSPRDEKEMREIAKNAVSEAALSAPDLNIEGKSIEEVRQQAHLHLVEAAANGQLDAAIANLEKQGVPPEEIEQLKKQVKGVLTDAVDAGELDDALQSAKGGEKAKSVQELREEAKATLLNATHEGTLNQAIIDVQGAGAANESEQLRQEVKGGPAAEASSAAPDAAAEGAMVPYSGGAAASSGQLVPLTGGDLLALSPSGNMSAEELQLALANGLREAINESVKGAVGDVVNHAFSQLKQEMVKRDVQSEELARQMTELTRSVTDLQATVTSPKGGSSMAAGSPAK